MANVPISGFTVPANTVGIGATGYSLTGSANASFVDLAGTWNTTGTPTLIKANVTDTASNAASLLMDLQVGGTSRVRVNKSAVMFLQSSSNTGVLSAGSDGFQTLQFGGPTFGSNGLVAVRGSQELAIRGVGSFAWENGGNNPASGTLDLFLTRKGAANLRLGAADAAAPVAQTLSVQGVVAGTTNTAGANLTIAGSQGTGSGAGGSIVFQVAPAGSSGTAQNALATALEINSARDSIFSGNVGLYSSTALRVGSSSVNWQVVATTTYVGQSSNNFFGFYNGTNLAAGGSFDVTLYRDAANTLALRNGTNAQTFRVYNTTDGTNSEYGFMRWNGTTFEIGATKDGTGTNRNVQIKSFSGVLQLNDGNSTASFTSGVFAVGTRSITQIINTELSGYQQLTEMTAPAAPAANGVRIYAVDNGSGKTQLMALFATGAAQQIAIEP